MKNSRIYQIWKSSLVIACLLICATAATLASASTARIFVLSAEDWARPRSGEVIVEFNAVRAAVDALLGVIRQLAVKTSYARITLSLISKRRLGEGLAWLFPGPSWMVY